VHVFNIESKILPQSIGFRMGRNNTRDEGYPEVPSEPDFDRHTLKERSARSVSPELLYKPINYLITFEVHDFFGERSSHNRRSRSTTEAKIMAFSFAFHAAPDYAFFLLITEKPAQSVCDYLCFHGCKPLTFDHQETSD
jgi:hypothetical protein